MKDESKVILCNACLIGLDCRYNGTNSISEKVLQLCESNVLIPICPEQLGGAPTPREPATQINLKVMTENGIDITYVFEKGAIEILKISELFNITEIILKEKGCGKIHVLNRLLNDNGLNIHFY